MSGCTPTTPSITTQPVRSWEKRWLGFHSWDTEYSHWVDRGHQHSVDCLPQGLFTSLLWLPRPAGDDWTKPKLRTKEGRLEVYYCPSLWQCALRSSVLIVINWKQKSHFKLQDKASWLCLDACLPRSNFKLFPAFFLLPLIFLICLPLLPGHPYGIQHSHFLQHLVGA